MFEVLQLFCTKFGAKQNPEKNSYKHINYLEEYYEVTFKISPRTLKNLNYFQSYYHFSKTEKLRFLQYLFIK